MIDKYVLCKACGNPETKLRAKMGKRMTMQCDACGVKSVLEYNDAVSESLIKYLKSTGEKNNVR